MFDYKYLRREHLTGFDNYKYHAVDTSPLSVYVMHPFWNKVVELVPRWVAPNVLTFAGFLLTVLDFLLVSYYDYSFYAVSTRVPLNTSEALPGAAAVVNGSAGAAAARGGIPAWCWLTMAISLFLAYTLDGIDGKQARRTQTSGPLGELFDHGLDSYSVFFIPVCLYSAFGRLDYSLPPIRMYFILWSIMFSFYTSHWEKYCTGVLYLPWGYDFSMWGGCAVFTASALYGTGLWKVTLLGLTAADMFEVVIYGTGLLMNIPISVYNVYMSYRLKTGAMRSPLEAARPAWSPLVMFALSTLWVLSSPGDVAAAHPRALYLLMGTLFSNICCRLIVAQMSGQRCEALCWTAALPAAGVAAALAAPAHEMRALHALVALAVAAHVHYGACVVRQMCQHFRISCFHIKKRSD